MQWLNNSNDGDHNNMQHQQPYMDIASFTWRDITLDPRCNRRSQCEARWLKIPVVVFFYSLKLNCYQT